MKIWWVKDPLTGETLENTYYSTKELATARRNEMGYGAVTSWEPLEGSQFYEENAGGKIRVFPD